MNRVAGSFRDPSGFIIAKGRDIYRQINKSYQNNFEFLEKSGLSQELIQQGLLIPYQKAPQEFALTKDAYCVISPQKIPFISYPYEWCFSQLKEAALLTLRIQSLALEKGMILKDCSAYNVQFLLGKPIFIDSLSFEIYQEGKPWVAYRQFCQHFLAPLSLMSYVDIRLGKLLRSYIDGIPLDLASRLLPLRSHGIFSLLTHLHLHARSQSRHAASVGRNLPRRKVSKLAMRGLVDSLRTGVERLNWVPSGTEWGDYYKDTNYSGQAMTNKKNTVADYLNIIQPSLVWDLGGNIGEFSRLSADKNIPTICFDIDPAAVEKCYRSKRSNLLPLLMDLTNPSPSLGWGNEERDSIKKRGPADAVIALALLHHLAISNNVPLSMIAQFFATIGRWLIIEFIPKDDSQIQRLLSTREDIFPDYNQNNFEEEFSQVFELKKKSTIEGSRRILYMMESRKFQL